MSSKKITLFIPCIVDQVYPEIGFATLKLLRHLDCEIIYDRRQTCCGQPAFNAGHRKEALNVAAHFVEIFKSAEVIVGPSGSCIAMIKNYYPLLFKDHALLDEAKKLANRTFELSEFLILNPQQEKLIGSYPFPVGYHHSCHSFRELRITDAPLRLLEQQRNIRISQPSGDPVCCGFGGLFSMKYDSIAASMANSRISSFMNLDVEKIITNDPGCLMHMRQEARDRKLSIEVIHLAEALTSALQLK
jgi:L-lactate dehydrogenase complex protein LldE